MAAAVTPPRSAPFTTHPTRLFLIYNIGPDHVRELKRRRGAAKETSPRLQITI
jgi:hypothetical protein